MRTEGFRSALAALALAALIAGCATPPPPAPVAAPAPAAPPIPAEPAGPPPSPVAQMTMLPIDDAVLNAADFAFARIPAPAAGNAGAAKPLLMIDTFVDGATGAQSNATRAMATRIADFARNRYPHIDVQTFSAAALARSPLVLVGTLTAIDSQGDTGGARENYRVCLALVDLGSGKIAAKSLARAQTTGVDASSLAYYADSPVTAADKAAIGDAAICHGARRGDAVPAGFRERVASAGPINAAIDAYNSGKYKESLESFRQIAKEPSGDRWQAQHGVLLASLKLERQADATQAFGWIVDDGLSRGGFAVRFAFKPGTSQLVADPKIGSTYRGWLRQIAQRAAKGKSCLQVVGHVDATGSEAERDRLALQRAQFVKQRLDAEAPALKKRSTALARGTQAGEAGSGSGANPMRVDSDPRIEFRAAKC